MTGTEDVLVPPENSDALSQALREQLANPKERSRLGDAGYARVRKDFSMSTGIETLLMRFAEDLDLKAAE